MTRRALKSVRSSECCGTISTTVRRPSSFCSGRRDATSEGGDPLFARLPKFGSRLDLHREFVHRAVAGDDDSMLAAVTFSLVEDCVDLARIDILATDREHVVDPAE